MWHLRQRVILPLMQYLQRTMQYGTIKQLFQHTLQDAHYKGAQKLGHGIGYKYAHDYPNHYVDQQYLPDEIKDARFYEPGDRGL